MKWVPEALRAVVVACSLVAVSGCQETTFRAKFTRQRALDQQGSVDTSADFVKCHVRDGSVYVLADWRVDTTRRVVSGEGEWHGPWRDKRKAGRFEVGFDDIVLLETTRPETVTHTGLVVMGVVAGVSLGVTAFCAANPKACFGSCPTFYADDGNAYTLQAEGFSASVARAFEATDVDALYDARPSSRQVSLWVTNEALETHFIDSVALLAVPRPAGERVYRTGDSFRSARELAAPSRCTALLGDCLDAVSKLDGREYFSRTDGQDLGAKETLALEFPRRAAKLGLVLGARNTLLNTFVFYQGLAYLGRGAGEFFARLDQRGAAAGPLGDIGRLLGGVDVDVELANGEVVRVGSFAEVGPIAREVELFVLPEGLPPDSVRIRLTCTRANFRFDYAGLVEVGQAIEPTRLAPVAVTRDGKPDHVAQRKLGAGGEYLHTFPGDAYLLSFELPSDGAHELFVESRGYYYEWMREDWLEEESELALLGLLTDPAKSFRDLAPRFHELEPRMDELFWKSRVPTRSGPGRQP